MFAVFQNFHTDVRGGKCSVDISCRSLIAYFHFQLVRLCENHRPVPIPSDVSRRTRRKFLAQLRPCTLIESGYKRDRSAASENRLRAHSSFCAVLVYVVATTCGMTCRLFMCSSWLFIPTNLFPAFLAFDGKSLRSWNVNGWQNLRAIASTNKSI